MGLPLSNETSSSTLRGPNSPVTFDPLAVAAVLPNPRADISATRLYTQYHNDSFRWPFLMMLGGTLPALSALVEQVVSPNQSIHPALNMVLKTASKLTVRSTTIFQELPLDFSNEWLADVCNYKPSDNANNDFLVINIDNETDDKQRKKGLAERMRALVFPIVGFFTGAVLITELVLSVLLGDIWGAVLFFVYVCHWSASTLISLSDPLIGPYVHAPSVKEDAEPSFSIHERKEGGTIIFKGRKDSMERWARQTWQFNATLYNKSLHWFWILSGTAAAVASTMAMVNMSAALQLGFLALLLFSSLAELALARLSRTVQVRPHNNSWREFKNNAFRSEAIIRSALADPPQCRLQGLDWIRLRLLPDILPFSEMLKALARLDRTRSTANLSSVSQVIDEYKKAAGSSPLVDRIAGEMLEGAKKAFTISEKSSAVSEKHPTVAGTQEASR